MKTLKRLLCYVRPFRKNLTLSIVFAFFGILLSLLVPVFIGLAVDTMVGAGNVDFAALRPIVLLLAGIIAGSALLQWGMSYHANQLSCKTVEKLRNDAFQKLARVPVRYIDAHEHGDILSTAVTDIDIVGTGLLQGFTQVFSGVVTILGTLIFMFVLNPWLALVVVVLTPLSFFVSAYIAKHTYNRYRQQSRLRGALTGFAAEMIENEATVKAFSMETENTEKFEKLNVDMQKIGVTAHFFSALSNPCTRFVNATVYAGVAAVGAVLCVQGGLSIGALTSFLAYCTQYTKPFNEISGVVAEFQNALSGAARVFQLLDAHDEPAQTDAPNLEVHSGSVAFEKVSFGYHKGKTVIRDFNLQVQAGQTVAIVGPTGSGKTTLLNLLLRFYEVGEGKIVIDGQDIAAVTRDSLRAQFGMVLQDTWLFRGTVRENIAYGVTDATEAQIIAAAKAAHAHSFIRRLPDGYDTLLTENGDNISEGQRQLLSIARVMLKKPPILILDEATSNIDTRTEIRIQKAFAELMTGRTCFMVAHRLSTVQKADCILVMQNGTVVEQGTHEQLLAQNGFYKQLYESQFAQ